MRPIIIEWDGTNVPEDLKKLPPGRYLLGPAYELWDDDELTEEEDAGIQLAIDQIDAGQGIPLDEAMRQIRSRVRVK